MLSSSGRRILSLCFTNGWGSNLPVHSTPWVWQQTAKYAKADNPKQRKQQLKQHQKKKKGGGAAAEAGGGGADAEGLAYDDEAAPLERNAVHLVLQAVHNVTPVLDVRTERAATKTLYIPGLMPPRKGRSLAVHWLVQAAEARRRASRTTMAQALALEMLLAYQRQGPARQKRDDLHRLALQNRANLHLRWW